jgi:hypothetical protein
MSKGQLNPFDSGKLKKRSKRNNKSVRTHTPGKEVCHDGWFPCPLHSHKVKGRDQGTSSFETIISFVICLPHSIDFDLLHGKNLSCYSFSTSIFMNHFVHM